MKILSKIISFNLIKDGEKGEPGEPGKPGPMPINAGQWNKDVEYIKDEFIQPYVWQLNSSNSKREYYLLMKSTSLGDNPYINNTQGSGDIWRRVEKLDLFLARKIQADEIDTKNLVSTHVKTAESGPRITLSGSEMKVYGLGEFPNIIFGVDNNGYAVMTYYSNDGQLIYDLGPHGINWGSIQPAAWNEIKLVDTKVTSEDPRFSDFSFYATSELIYGTTYWKYFAGSNPSITQDEKQKEYYTYTTKGNLDLKISDGWYMTEGAAMQTQAGNTTALVKPFGDNGLYEFGSSVRDTPPIYFRNILKYEGGIVVARKYLCWNGDPFGQGGGEGGFIDPRA